MFNIKSLGGIFRTWYLFEKGLSFGGATLPAPVFLHPGTLGVKTKKAGSKKTKNVRLLERPLSNLGLLDLLPKYDQPAYFVLPNQWKPRRPTSLNKKSVSYVANPIEEAKGPVLVFQTGLIYSFPGWAPGREGVINNTHVVVTGSFDRSRALGGTDPGPSLWASPVVTLFIVGSWFVSLFGTALFVGPLYYVGPAASGLINLVSFSSVVGLSFTGVGTPLSYIVAVFLLFAGDILPSFYLSPNYVEFLFWFCTGRFLTPFVVNISYYLGRFLDGPSARWLAIRIVWSSIFLWCVFYLSANLVTVYFYFFIVMAFPFSLILVITLICLPIILVINLSCIMQITVIIYMCITGDYSLIDTSRGVFMLWGKWGSAIHLFVKSFLRDPFWLIFGSQKFVNNALTFSSFLLKLPLEIYYNLVEEDFLAPKDFKRVRHLKSRLTLSLVFFFSSLLNALWIIKAVIFMSTLLFIVLYFIVVIALGLNYYELGFFCILQTIFNFFGLAIARVADTVLSGFKVDKNVPSGVLNVILMGMSVFNPTFNIRVKNSDGTLFLVTARSDPSDWTPKQRLAFYGYILKYRPFTLSWIFLFGALYSLRFIIKCITGVFYKFVSVPLRIFDAFVFACIPFLLPDFVFDISLAGLAYIFLFYEQHFRAVNLYFYRLARALSIFGVSLFPYLSSLDPEADFGVTAQSTENLKGGAERISKIFIYQTVQMTRRSVLRFVSALDDFRLPEMIQAAYKPPTIESIRTTYQFFADMGMNTLPGFVDSLQPVDENHSYLTEWGSWRNWLKGSSNFRLGFRDLAVSVNSWLPTDFYPDIPGFIHTSTFTGVAEEIASTARYWTGNDKNYTFEEFDDILDGLWEGVKIQFANSALSSPEEIFASWEKRFNMGFGFGEIVRGKLRQLNRWYFINQMGGRGPFIAFWKKVFRISQYLDMPAPVFTKMENLKVKKALARAVRTVIGSPFGHHVMTTVFNYKPNHNYKVWNTPMKVGMPINGQNFGKLWESLRTREAIFAGDMTAFDSTQSPVVVRMVAELRKKGFTLHKDYHAIAQLIDLSYDKLLTQPMGFKNFGDIATKGQGFTTGHSSTSSDNSLALVINYLYAWRIVTGVRAREFFNFNTLANFGDDHVLAYDRVFGWSPVKAMEAMAHLGTIMRDEAPGVSQLPGGECPFNDWRDSPFNFLSKMPLPIDGQIKSELQAAGVKLHFSYATCHRREKLIGKIKGEVLAYRSKDALRSYQVLLSYIDLTAHHNDLYQKLVKQAHFHYNLWSPHWEKNRVPKKLTPVPPSYNQVLRKWYNSEASFTDPDKNEDDALNDLEDSIVIIETPDTFGLVVRWLADFPTMLSPRYGNLRWADWLQKVLAKELSWPLTLIAQAHGKINDPAAVKATLARTPYSFLRGDLLMSQDGHFGANLFRHWLYCTFSRLYSRSRSISILDLVRVLDSVFINANFIVFAKVTTIVAELDLHLVETLVVFLLSFVEVKLPVGPILFDFSAPSLLFARLLSFWLRYFAPAGSIDFQSFDASIDRLSNDPDYKCVYSAPTGTGKSTRMMARLVDRIRRRVIVIVPRHLIAVSVGQYMQQLYPEKRIGISTMGFKLKGDEALIYCTAQSFFTNPNLRTPGSVYVLDEAHIDEPVYHCMINFLEECSDRVMYFTATPPERLARREHPDDPTRTLPIPLVEIPAVNQNVVDTITRTVPTVKSYLNHCVAFTNDRLPFEKVLIFVTSLRDAHDLAGRIKHVTCILSSKNKDIDPLASVFITTNVSDAGLTIPDVGFVFSMSHDIRVTSEEKDLNEDGTDENGDRFVGDAQKSRPYFIELPEATIKQRRGRTGRTIDGLFFHYTVVQVSIEPLTFSLPDYFHNCFPAAKECIPWFPEHVRDELSSDIEATLPIWDLSPNYTWTGMMNLVHYYYDIDDYTSSSPLSFADWCLSKLNDAKQMPWGNVYDPDEVPFGESTRPDPDPDVDSDGEPLDEEVPQRNQPRDPDLFRRLDVSGNGLLCGIRALRGLIFTHLHINPSEDLVQYWVRMWLPEDAPDRDNMYHFNALQDAAYRHFRLRVQLEHAGNLLPLPVYMTDDRYPVALLYLVGMHYNYFGLPIRGATNDDIPENMFVLGPLPDGA